MEFEPKPISKDAVPAALEKAERYRLLNEPAQAESICQDVLAIDPDNQRALVTMLLSITDHLQTHLSAGAQRARALLPKLESEYHRHYYAGIICERYAMAVLAKGAPRAGETAYGLVREAMTLYEKAERLRPHGEDEAILRWNTCARLLDRIPHLTPPKQEEYEPSFE
ncbi:MAG TPA: hypothetical protein VE967_12740 [Gemmatimonadaceae bacterium]|nr:hypothetical protein [Gemmatimonadaceae bacterium]